MRSKDIQVTAKSLTELLFRTFYSFKEDARTAGEIGIGTHPFSVMIQLYYADSPKSVSDLADLLHMNNPQLSKILGLIEEKGFISRIRQEDNRRRVIVSLTKEGTAFIKKKISIFEESVYKALEEGGFSSADGQAASKILESLYAVMFC